MPVRGALPPVGSEAAGEWDDLEDDAFLEPDARRPVSRTSREPQPPVADPLDPDADSARAWDRIRRSRAPIAATA